MSYVRGGDVVLVIDGADVSPLCTSLEFERSLDHIDTATFGAAGHTYAGGLLDGTVAARGAYDSTTGAGPRELIGEQVGQVVTLDYQVEGDSASVQGCRALVVAYGESGEVFDMVAWHAEFQIAGVVGAVVDPYPATYTSTY